MADIVPACVSPIAIVRDLAELEAIVERGLATFVEVGAALMEIRDGRLYRESHATFEDYCIARWRFSREQGRRLIQAAQVIETLPPIGGIPATESQARELVPLLSQPEELREAWAEIVATHDKPTADAIHKIVQRRDGERRYWLAHDARKAALNELEAAQRLDDELASWVGQAAALERFLDACRRANAYAERVAGFLLLESEAC